jgi:hypothetical protein
MGDADAYLSKFATNGSFQSVMTIGSGLYDSGKGVSVDGSGNIYMCGAFSGTVDLDPTAGSDIHTSTGGSDFYLVKLASGSTFNWAVTWGGPYADDTNHVSANSSGDAYVLGQFETTIDFKPGDGIVECTSNGWMDVYLSKFPPEGEW